MIDSNECAGFFSRSSCRFFALLLITRFPAAAFISSTQYFSSDPFAFISLDTDMPESDLCEVLAFGGMEKEVIRRFSRPEMVYQICA